LAFLGGIVNVALIGETISQGWMNILSLFFGVGSKNY
jgi:hypothetical protein